MSNIFVTPSDVMMDANLFLVDNLVVGNLVSRKTEARFAARVGDTVKVKCPAAIDANEFVSTTSASAITQVGVEVVLQKHFYVRVDLTSDELTLKLDDFLTSVTLPAVRGLIGKIENYFIQKMVGGFAQNIVGTAGNQPSTHAHILAAEQKVFTNKGDITNLVGVITPTAHTSFAQLAIFQSADYGTDRPAGLASNSLGRCANISYFRSPYADTFDRGDVAGTLLVKGAAQTGTSLIVDGFTGATGTVKEGTRFTIAGVSGTYTVSADATIAANQATLVLISALASAPADDAALTLAAAFTENMIYNPSAVAGAIIAGAKIGVGVESSSIGGVGLRIISDVSTSTLAGTWVFDLYAGCRVVQPAYGSLMQG